MFTYFHILQKTGKKYFYWWKQVWTIDECMSQYSLNILDFHVLQNTWWVYAVLVTVGGWNGRRQTSRQRSGRDAAAVGTGRVVSSPTPVAAVPTLLAVGRRRVFAGRWRPAAVTLLFPRQPTGAWGVRARGPRRVSRAAPRLAPRPAPGGAATRPRTWTGRPPARSTRVRTHPGAGRVVSGQARRFPGRRFVESVARAGRLFGAGRSGRLPLRLQLTWGWIQRQGWTANIKK